MGDKRWIVQRQDDELVRRLARELKLSRVTARLLINRSLCDAQSARAFIDAGTQALYDPFLLKDMDRAVARVNAALDAREHIIVYGDYDVDGITSVAAVYGYLSGRGAHVSYYIPDRVDEGYGMNAGAVDRIAQLGATLIITVDLGITDAAEVDYARTKGIDVVITDHHECKAVLPDAAAVVNPKRPDCTYPEKALAGVGVAFKLLCALSGDTNGILRDYGEIVAIGTIADVMPLTGENRAIARYGLDSMQHSGSTAIRAIVSESGAADKKMTSSVVSYAIAPRLNAAGRISAAGEAVELLLCRDDRRAREMAAELSRLNTARQEEGERILDEAVAQIERDFDFERDRVIVLDGEGWHHGVIGVASIRITDRYYLPSILITTEGAEGKGSGRSIAGFNLFEALTACAPLLRKYGGHEQAAGLSIARENIPAFREAVNDYARERVTDDMLIPELTMECELRPGDITTDVARQIGQLEPFGRSNPQPRFLVSGAKLMAVQPIGGDRHIRLQLECGSRRFWAVYFGRVANDFPFYPGDVLDVCCNLELNTYREQTTAQLIIRDVRRSEHGMQGFAGYAELYGRLTDGGELTDTELRHITPGRKDFVAVFRALGRLQKDGAARVRYESLSRMVEAEFSVPMNYCRLRVCLDIFAEMGIISLVPSGEEAVVVPLKQDGKKDLGASKILIGLKARREREHG